MSVSDPQAAHPALPAALTAGARTPTPTPDMRVTPRETHANFLRSLWDEHRQKSHLLTKCSQMPPWAGSVRGREKQDAVAPLKELGEKAHKVHVSEMKEEAKMAGRGQAALLSISASQKPNCHRIASQQGERHGDATKLNSGQRLRRCRM